MRFKLKSPLLYCSACLLEHDQQNPQLQLFLPQAAILTHSEVLIDGAHHRTLSIKGTKEGYNTTIFARVLSL